jgi:uncharacterized phage protein gp47/JayE
MADLPDRAALFAVGRRSIRTAPNTRINPAVVDVPGSDVNLVVGQSALMGEELSRAWAHCIRGLFVDTADDEQIDRLVADRYQMRRKDANAAQVDLVLERPTFAAGGGTIPAGEQVQTAAGVAFTLDADAVFGATDLSRLAEATATATGPGSNVSAGAVWSFAAGPFDPSIAISNPGPAAGGADRESRIQLVARARGFFATIRRGVIGAIEQAAREVAGVAVAHAFEVVNPDAQALPAAAVQLVVGDADGNATGGMLQRVRDNLLAFRACGIPVLVVGGSVVFEAVAWRGLEYAAGLDSQRAQSDVRAVTVAVAQFLQPGESLHLSTLIAAAKAVPGVVVPAGALAAPVGDVVAPDDSTIIRVRAQDVTFA